MLTDVYFPRVNGVSSSIRTFARDLQRRGHAVTIVAPDYGAANTGEDGIEILRVAARTIFFDPEDKLMQAAAVRQVERALARRHWDVIHIHTPFRAHGLGVRLAKQLGCASVESYHTYFEEYAAHYLPWLPAGILRFAARRLSRYLCADVDHLIVPTAEMAAVLDRYGIDTPSTIVPTGIALEEFRGGDGLGFRRELKIDDAAPTLVTVSRLAAEKNIGFLLEVTKKLVEQIPELVFVIAGEGPDAPRLRKLADELELARNVRFVGNLDRRTRLLDCYKAGDIFVFASPTETQGLVLVEAMSLGVPIVSTAQMGTATVLKDARSACVAPPEVERFAATVFALLQDAPRRQLLAAAGPEDAKAWSAPILMQRVVDLYARLQDERGRPKTLATPEEVASNSG